MKLHRRDDDLYGPSFGLVRDYQVGVWALLIHCDVLDLHAVDCAQQRAAV